MQTNTQKSCGLSREPLAIVGIGCRVPGGVENPSEFWELIKDGTDAIIEVPRDRWNLRKFYDPDPDKPGKMYMRAGGFLRQRIDQFDALFFGVSPREAACMDPQQRLLLEVAWEALEDGGFVPEELAGSDTGVFIGAFTLDNKLTQMGSISRDLIGTHTAIGSTMTILSNRLSYFFDFRGPSLSIDTACSSSLVAFHYACQAIWRGECSLALAGGVNVIYRPEYNVAMCKGQFLAPDGHCKSFDARANGYARGEGAGIVILKPFSLARRDNDPIYALVCGTGVNQDGRTNGITVPNPKSQAALIRQVCQQAGIEPGQIRYFEAHGTGTTVGDPAEASALGEVVGANRTPDNACAIGSVKANIGHLEAASGIAGLIKASLCLKHRQIPPLANLQTPNPKIPFDELGLRLPRRLEPMPGGDGLAYIGINSFGYGGTNAHAILTEAPQSGGTVCPADATANEQSSWPHLLPLSARSRAALEALAQAYAERLTAPDAPSLHDLCYSASVHRSHHPYRIAVTTTSAQDMGETLRGFVAHGRGEHIAVGTTLEGVRKPVFVFTGMGPQWGGMGRELLRESTVFRQQVEACDAIFQRLAGWSILAEMTADEMHSRARETQIAQPANFVLQAGLAALWRSKGIEPVAIVGHSVGEVTAAYVAGVLSLEDAVRVSYHRSRIQKKAAGLGTMLATGLAEGEARELLDAYDGHVSVAAANSPSSVTLAGDAQTLQEIAARLEAQGMFNRFLQVEVAYHSPCMDPLREELLESLQDLRPVAPSLPLYSTVTGQRVEGIAYDADYWWQNVRQPVYFAKAIASLVADGHRLFLEVGPHPVLATSIKECLATGKAEGTTVATLHREQPEVAAFVDALGALYTAGCAVDWRRLYPKGGHYVTLPTYPWQRETHWQESEESRQDRLGEPDHALLGNRATSPGTAWEGVLNRGFLPYLDDHHVEDLKVLAGAAYVEAGLAIHRQATGMDACVLEGLSFFNALVIDAGDEPVLRCTYDEKLREYAVYSRTRDDAARWKLHATGSLSTALLEEAAEVDLEALRERCTIGVDAARHYANMTRRGLQYGPWFQGVWHLWLNPERAEVLARIDGHAQLGEPGDHGNRLHPTLLDACFQALLATAENDDVFIPVHIREVRFHRSPGNGFWCHGRQTRNDPASADDGTTLEGDVILFDGDSRVLAEVLGVRAQRLSRQERDAVADWFYRFDWTEAQPAPVLADAGHWLLFLDAGGVGERLAARLLAAGAESIVRVLPGDEYRREAADRFRVRRGNRDDLAQVLAAVDPQRCQRAACLWGLDAPTAADDPTGTGDVNHCLALIQAMTHAYRNQCPHLFVLTRNAQPVGPDLTNLALAQAPLVGLVRVALNEYPECRYGVIDTDATNATALAAVVAELLAADPEDEVVLRGEQRFVHRFNRVPAEQIATATDAAQPIQVAPGHPFQIEAGVGDVPRWRETRRREPGPGEVEIRIHAAGLDAGAAATARCAAAGVVTRVGGGVTGLAPGEAVVAALPRAIASYATVAVAATPMAHKPEGLSFEQAAALPVTYASAWYALHHLGAVQVDARVLVHAATGDTGRAAVAVARRLGAQVLVAADGDDSTEDLRALGVGQVLNARSTAFAGQVMAATDGHGVDVVLNAGGGEALARGVSVLAEFGRYLDFSSGRARDDNRLSLLGSRCNLSYQAVDTDCLLAKRPALYGSLLAEVCQRFAASELDKPALEVFPAQRLVEACRRAADPQRTGKVVLALHGQSAPSVLPVVEEKRPFREDGTYLITGGFGGFGMEIAKWMVCQGARHLVLVSRRGAATPEARAAVKTLESAGARIMAAVADITREDQVEHLIREISDSLPPLRGVWHAAAVFDDTVLNELNAARFDPVMRPKALGAWHLHRHTQGQPLDHFVLFSSISAQIGSPAQGSYVAANVYLDALAHSRRAQGLAATSINWGALGNVGVVARYDEVKEYLERVGSLPMTPAQAVSMLGNILARDPIQITFVQMDWDKWAQFNPAWARSRRFLHLIAGSADGQEVAGDNELLHTLTAMTPEEREQAFTELLAEQVAETFRLPLDKVDRQQSLTNIGADSLMAMELQTAIQNRLGIKVSTLELMKGISVAQLAKNLLLRLEEVSPVPAAGADGTVSSADTVLQNAAQLLDGLGELTEEKVDALLNNVMVQTEVQS